MHEKKNNIIRVSTVHFLFPEDVGHGVIGELGFILFKKLFAKKFTAINFFNIE